MSEREFEKLRAFMVPNIVEDESTGLACTGNARFVVEAALNNFGVEGRILELSKGQGLSHAYVVLSIQKEIELALNQQSGRKFLTVGEVVQQGVDITREVLHTPWENLG